MLCSKAIASISVIDMITWPLVIVIECCEHHDDSVNSEARIAAQVSRNRPIGTKANIHSGRNTLVHLRPSSCTPSKCNGRNRHKGIRALFQYDRVGSDNIRPLDHVQAKDSYDQPVDPQRIRCDQFA